MTAGARAELLSRVGLPSILLPRLQCGPLWMSGPYIVPQCNFPKIDAHVYCGKFGGAMPRFG